MGASALHNSLPPFRARKLLAFLLEHGAEGCSRARGADIMVPMAIPSFGGMTIALLSVFIVPILYCWVEERNLKKRSHPRAATDGTGLED